MPLSVFPSLILAVGLTSLVTSVCIDEHIICYCGHSYSTVSIPCTTRDEHENPCAAYEHCESCEDDVPYCITCPRGYFGAFCDNENVSSAWNDGSNMYDDIKTGRRLVVRDLSCQNLRAPKLGSIQCWFQGYEKECTGKCAPGHSFSTGDTEIKLTCQSGVWLPRSSFPPCISEGYCKIQITGAGYYNCTVGSSGTFCDITCQGRRYRPTFGRFHCFPGESWNPPLPYCAKETDVEENWRDKTPSCKCQNGGSCSSRNRECICPPGYRGKLCDITEYDTRRQCPTPPQIDKGVAQNPDGSIVTQQNKFYEGSSVVYSCQSGYYLAGKSLLTCTQFGPWSDLPPKCMLISAPTPEPRKVICPDPGQVANGVRRSLNNRRVSQEQSFDEDNNVIFSCNDGFALIGESMLTCTSSGEWSSSLPICRSIKALTTESPEVGITYCKDPGVDYNGVKTVSPWVTPRRNVNTEETEYPQGTEIQYSCKNGYDLEGESSVLCLFSGIWSSPIPRCRRKFSSTTTTTDDGLVYCKDPGVDPNGIKTISVWIDARKSASDTSEEEHPQGTKINYSCKEGYELEGEIAIICLFSGYWSSPTPKCRSKVSAALKEAHCENPGDIFNGRKNILPFIDPRTNQKMSADSVDFPKGVKLVVYCDTGFKIQGSKIIECTETGSWSSAIPTCERQASEQLQGCGHSSFAVVGKILHGEKTEQGQWPWQVAYAENRRLGMTLTCGAVLISPSIALTAAHCILPRRREKTFLYFGKYYANFNEDDQEVLSRQASEFIVHPRYNRRNMDNDIAMVRFSPEVPYNNRIQPICLPSRDTTSSDLRNGNTGWVTGWGTTENGTDSDILLMVELPVVSNTQCRDTYRRVNPAVQITDNMYCAGYSEGGADSCAGDSGGPMVFYNGGTESYVLEGIVSFGVKGPTGSCGQKDRYGVYTKVSNYVTWISRYT